MKVKCSKQAVLHFNVWSTIWYVNTDYTEGRKYYKQATLWTNFIHFSSMLLKHFNADMTMNTKPIDTKYHSIQLSFKRPSTVYCNIKVNTQT